MNNPSGWAFPKVSLSDQVNRFERVLIEDALAEHHGNATLPLARDSEADAPRQDAEARPVDGRIPRLGHAREPAVNAAVCAGGPK
jgi:hypothetical protein